MAFIIVTESEPDARKDLAAALTAAGHTVRRMDDPNELPRVVTQEPVDIVLLDMLWITLESLDVIHFIKSANPAIEIVTLTPIDHIRQAAMTILRGAGLYLVDPVNPEEVLQIIINTTSSQHNALVIRGAEHKRLESLFGSSPSMTKLFRTVLKVAPTDATVLVTGESGTGKELLSHVIHRLSRRSGQRIIAVNCAAIPESLLESELFGHVKGAFTGAATDKKGLLEEADGGTCFLDEVGDLALSAQAKLLRFLQDRMVRRVGGTSQRQVNVRIIAATNRNLAADVVEGRFREDLFYRLNVISLHLLPLRERKETLPLLTMHLLSRLESRYNKQVRGFSPDAMRCLGAYSYPGNIRELENILEYAVIMCDGEFIEANDLPPHIAEPGTLRLTEAPQLPPAIEEGEVASAPGPLKTLEEKEAEYIQEVLKACGGNQTEAAKVLGISRTSLWRRISKGAAERTEG
jgi:DNA-binding NtrC family response regulator